MTCRQYAEQVRDQFGERGYLLKQCFRCLRAMMPPQAERMKLFQHLVEEALKVHAALENPVGFTNQKCLVNGIANGVEKGNVTFVFRSGQWIGISFLQVRFGFTLDTHDSRMLDRLFFCGAA